MVAIAVFNLLLAVYVFCRSRPSHPRNSGNSSDRSRIYQKMMRRLAWPFVFECAWRSVFPCLYNQRQVLIDSPLSAILLDRSLAAIGEVCWVTQISLALEEIHTSLSQQRSRSSSKVSFSCFDAATVLMVLLAMTGEVCSYLGTATTNALYEVLEASCWCSLFSIGAVCGLVLCLKIRRSRLPGNASAKRFTGVMVVTGLTYCPYMLLANIPMYYQRWQNDQAHHKKYLPIIAGLKDAAVHRIPTSEWSAWRDDWFWMSFYFSFAVWSSILLMYAPRLQKPRTAAVLEVGDAGRLRMMA